MHTYTLYICMSYIARKYMIFIVSNKDVAYYEMYIILAPSTFVCGATIVVSAIYISAYVVAAYGYMYTAVIPNITIYLKYIVCMSQAT